MTNREKYCEKLLDRLIDACRDVFFPGEDVSARKNAHDNTKGLARLGLGSYQKWLMKYGREWVALALRSDFTSPEHLDPILTSRGY